MPNLAKIDVDGQHETERPAVDLTDIDIRVLAMLLIPQLPTESRERALKILDDARFFAEWLYVDGNVGDRVVAMSLAHYLPKDEKRLALRVLNLARELVTDYLYVERAA